MLTFIGASLARQFGSASLGRAFGLAGLVLGTTAIGAYVFPVMHEYLKDYTAVILVLAAFVGIALIPASLLKYKPLPATSA